MSDCTSYFKSQQQRKDSANSKIGSNTSSSMHDEYVNKNKYDYTKPLLLNKKYLQLLKNILRSRISIQDINSNKKENYESDSKLNNNSKSSKNWYLVKKQKQISCIKQSIPSNILY